MDESPAVQQKPLKKPRGKPFPKGVNGRTLQKVIPPTPEGMVADFDYVYRTAEGPDETPSQKYARGLYKKSFEKFVEVYNRLLKAAEVAEKKKPQTVATVNVTSVGVEAGEQEEGVARLIEQLLGELVR